MTDLPLPAELEIRHRFLTASAELYFSSPTGEKLYEVRCPSLRLRRCAYVYAAGNKKEMLFWMCPVWGLSWNVQINLPNDEILGVLQKEKDEATGITEWVALDAYGKKLLSIRPEGSAFGRLKKRLTLFSSQEERIFVGDQRFGTFTRRAGYVHERYSVKIKPEAKEIVDARFLLAITTGLTGIFNRLFV